MKRRTKAVLVWLILIIVFSIGGFALWLKIQDETQIQHHEDPGIPAGIEVPDPDSEEE